MKKYFNVSGSRLIHIVFKLPRLWLLKISTRVIVSGAFAYAQKRINDCRAGKNVNNFIICISSGSQEK